MQGIYSIPNRTGAYTEKIIPSAPHKSPKSRENLLFLHSGAYTEKTSWQIHFFVISGAQGDDFSAYAPFPTQNRVNREDITYKWGTVEHFFCICPIPRNWHQNFATLRKIFYVGPVQYLTISYLHYACVLIISS